MYVKFLISLFMIITKILIIWYMSPIWKSFAEIIQIMPLKQKVKQSINKQNVYLPYTTPN